MKFYTLRAALLASFCVSGVAAAADPAADPGSIVTVRIENDAISIPATDELYTSGEELGYVAPTGALPEPLSALGRQIFGRGTQRLAFNVSQVIFTPTDTQAYDPNPHDLPYSAALSLRVSLIQDSESTRSIAQVAAGVVGPDALGQSVQNGFHEIIGQTPNRGWRYQLKNEPTLDVYGARIWRDDVLSGPVSVQVLPDVSAQAGNTEIYAQAGGIVRFGQGLDSDFGPGLIQPGADGTDAYVPTQNFVWYVFGGAVGRVVAHDIFVQGNDFQRSRHVGLLPLQADVEVGAAVIVYGLRVSATEIYATPQFAGSAPAFQYGSLAVSGRF
jgi:hypothetical protein